MESSNLIARIFWNYIYAGRKWNLPQGHHVSFVTSFSIIGVSASIIFGLLRVLGGIDVGYFEIAIGVVGILNIFYLRLSGNVERASQVILLIMVVMLSFLFIDGGIAGTGIFWAFTFPVLAFFLFDDEKGLIWNLLLLGILAIIWAAQTAELVNIYYHGTALRQAFFSLAAVVGLLYFYTKFSALSALALEKRTKEITRHFEEEKKEFETHAQQVHHELAEKLNNFFELSGNLMCIANSKGYFLEVNPAFLSTLGYSRENLLSKPFVDLVHPDDREKTQEITRTSVSGKPIENFVNRYRKNDGTYVTLSWNAVFDEGFFYAIAHPVDELIGAQQNLNDRVAELERLNRLMVGRELKMVELKKEIADLKARIKD